MDYLVNLSLLSPDPQLDARLKSAGLSGCAASVVKTSPSSVQSIPRSVRSVCWSVR